MKHINYTLIFIWLVSSSCNRTAHVYFQEIFKNSNLEFTYPEYFNLKIKYSSPIIPIADNLKINKSTKTLPKPHQIVSNKLNPSITWVKEPPKVHNRSLRFEKTTYTTKLKKSFSYISPIVQKDVPASSHISDLNAQVLGAPFKNLIIPFLSFIFGALAILVVIPLYASGFIGGLITIPLAAIIAVSLGFIGLRKNPKKRNLLADCRYCHGFYQSRKPNAIVAVLSCLYLTGR
ncbi:MAG TPA: hypothetical protein PLN76_08880 [Saprospiraceae bacterium]|nr:hypothetical protein [Saprospiraceae bacterium]